MTNGIAFAKVQDLRSARINNPCAHKVHKNYDAVDTRRLCTSGVVLRIVKGFNDIRTHWQEAEGSNSRPDNS